MENNPVGWFEIPVIEMDRAKTFYETVFGFTLDINEMGELTMAWFPMSATGKGSAGSLVKHPMYQPAKLGTVVYFTSPSGDIANELAKVEEAGGKVIKQKESIGEYGFIGLVIDTEGNRIGFHNVK